MTIPQHILDRAAEYHEAIVKDGPESAIHHIARAIVEQAEMDSDLACDFQWVLPMHPTVALNEATDDAACNVQVQIANAIRNRVTQEE